MVERPEHLRALSSSTKAQEIIDARLGEIAPTSSERG